MLLDVLGAGPYGWFLGQKRPMLDAGDFSGTTFSLDLMAKDLQLAVDATPLVAGGAALAVTAASLEVARTALTRHADEDYAAMAAPPRPAPPGDESSQISRAAAGPPAD